MGRHKLYRSETDKILGGVCGGIAEKYNKDPSIIRILTAILVLAMGSGLLLYLIAWIVIPTKSQVISGKETVEVEEKE